jgi:hypothetical protein
MRMVTTIAAMGAVWLLGCSAAAQQSSQARTVPVGALIDLLLKEPLSSKVSKVDDRFETTSVLDVTHQSQVVIPAGAIARGFIGSLRASSRLNHQGEMTLSFYELQIGDQSLKLRATIVAVLDPTRRPPAARAGAPVDLSDRGATQALVGVVVSAAGSLLATNGGDVTLPPGAVLRVRIDRPIEIKGAHVP